MYPAPISSGGGSIGKVDGITVHLCRVDLLARLENFLIDLLVSQTAGNDLCALVLERNLLLINACGWISVLSRRGH